MNLKELSAQYDFAGRSIVVTGGTGVLGGAIARALVGCNANVAIVGRRPAMAEPPFAGTDATGGRLIAVQGDVRDVAALTRARANILEEFGRVDGLVNAAGGNDARGTTGVERSFFELSADALRSLVDLNLLGTVLPCQVFGQAMADRREGVILNVSSMSALRPLTRVPAYSAAKAAVTNFTQWLAVHMAREYGPGIRVNAIAPGFFLTEQNRFLLTDEGTGALTARGQRIIDHTPMRRFGTPEDLLGAVLWLLSPAAAFVTGALVPVDGGFAAYAGV